MQRNRTLRFVSAFAMLLSAATIGALSVSSQAAHPTTAAIGQPAPSFNLPNVASSKPVSLGSLAQGKKATVVIFVSTRCPVSNAYNERMAELAKRYEPKGISFVGIDSNQNEPVAECASWSAASKLGFPVLKDGNSAIADNYGATHTPEVYVIDPSGKLVYHGRIDSNMDEASVTHHDLADALNAILAGKPVPVTETKAFGCSIKRGGGW